MVGLRAHQKFQCIFNLDKILEKTATVTIIYAVQATIIIMEAPTLFGIQQDMDMI